MDFSGNSLADARRLLESGQVSQAISCLTRAVEQSPDDPLLIEELARAYRENGQYLPALRAYDRVIGMGAATARTWRATGTALLDVAECAQAIGAFENSLQLEDDHAETHHNLSRACYQMGQVTRSGHHLQRAIELSDAINSWQSLATLMPSLPEVDNQTIMEFRQKFAGKLADYTGTPWPPENRPQPVRHGGPIRIGYVCAFFHNANYTKPVWGLINRHDRSEFHISLFSDSPPEAGLPCYEPHAEDVVHDIRHLSNAEVLELIRTSGIDILVDLSAYSFEKRLGLFLGYAAPVNMAWWAMYATSGLPGVQYLISDDEMVKPDEEQFYTEELVKLPLSYFTFSVDYPVPPVMPPPCLQRGYLTFGSLVTQYKITPQVLDAWCSILTRAGESRLLLANRTLKSKNNQAWVLKQFEDRGVDPSRLILHGPADHFTYLKHYDNIDIALDAFPYNGGTTTIEAIWQGVPVLTFDGDRWISRTSLTLLRRCHLGPFVADDVDQMVELGVRWALDPEAPQKLSQLRSEMRETLAASSACDTAGLAASMEHFYRTALQSAIER